MKKLNSRIQHLKPSATLSVKTKATELRAEGRTIIDLSAGEPDIDTPDHIKLAAEKALADGATKYTPVPGEKALREAIAEKMTTQNGVPSELGNVIVTNGGKQALHEIFQVCLEPGDEVLIFTPYWVSYPPMVELAGGKPVIVQTRFDDLYKVTPDLLDECLDEKTKFVVINSPSNPTGAGYTLEELKALGEVLAKYPTMVISDEVYERITYDGFDFHSFVNAVPELADRTITVNAFSKTYSMTGWRVGYAVGPEEIIKGMTRFQSQTTSNVNSIAQRAALAALQGPHDFLEDLIASYKKRMELALSYIERTPGLSVASMPEGAFYLFVRINELILNSVEPELKGSVAFAEHLLNEGGVAIVPGEAFGDDLGFRMSISVTDDAIEAGMQKVEEVVNGIKLK